MSSCDSTSSEESRGKRITDSTSSNSESECTQIWVPPGGYATQRAADLQTTTFNTLSRKSNISTPHSCEFALSPNSNLSYEKRKDTPTTAPDSGISNESPASPTDCTECSSSHRDSRSHCLSSNYAPSVHSSRGSGSGRSSRSNVPSQRDPMNPALMQHNMEKNRAECRMSIVSSISGLYGICLTVLGITLPISESFTNAEHSLVFEMFYIYLYGLGIIFLGYVYCFVLRKRTQRHVEQADRKLITIISLSKGNSAGSFYLRLGAVVFGIGSMIHDGLRSSQFFEQNPFGECSNPYMLIGPLLHLIFTFTQLYFIFLNSKASQSSQCIFMFGLMHLVGTNLSTWFRTIVHETIHQITFHKPDAPLEIDDHGFHRHTKAHFNRTIRIANAFAKHSEPGLNSSGHLSCEKVDILGDVVEASSPYLYSCTVQYSIIAAAIIYGMWTLIGKHSSISFEKQHHEKRRLVNIDCSRSTKGLFFGLLVFVGTIIASIVFFVLTNKLDFVYLAVLLINVTEMGLFALASLGVILAFVKLQDLVFNQNVKLSLDDLLILLAQVALYVYNVFSLIAGMSLIHTKGGLLLFANSILSVFESSLQTLLILNGQRRACSTSQHENVKPGRESVTFLIVCNLALFLLSIFENQKTHYNPIQETYFGFLVWNIVQHICLPAVSFYRFHSSVCLANVWKNAYKTKG